MILKQFIQIVISFVVNFFLLNFQFILFIENDNFI